MTRKNFSERLHKLFSVRAARVVRWCSLVRWMCHYCEIPRKIFVTIIEIHCFFCFFFKNWLR